MEAGHCGQKPDSKPFCMKTLVTSLITLQLFIITCAFAGEKQHAKHGVAIYVADLVAGAVFKLDNHGNKNVFASGFDWPYALAFDSSQNLYVAEEASGCIKKIDPSGIVTLFASSLPPLRALAFDRNNNLYAATGNSLETSSILKLDPQGNVSGFASYATDPLLNQPWSLVFDDAGNLYASILQFPAAPEESGIAKFEPSGHGTVFASGIFNFFSTDNAGGFYATHFFYVPEITNYVTTIEQFDLEGNATLFTASSNFLVCLATDSDGNLYGGTGNDSPSKVIKFNPHGEESVFASDFGDARAIAVPLSCSRRPAVGGGHRVHRPLPNPRSFRPRSNQQGEDEIAAVLAEILMAPSHRTENRSSRLHPNPDRYPPDVVRRR